MSTSSAELQDEGLRTPSTTTPAGRHRRAGSGLSGWMAEVASGSRLAEGLQTVVPVWAFFTLVRWLVASISVLLVPSAPGATPSAAPGVLGLMDKWDAGLFLDIARHGYRLDENANRAAFFPGLPLVEHVFAQPLATIVDPADAEFYSAALVTTTCSLLAGLFLYLIVAPRFGRRTASWSVVLLMTWPSAAFLTAFYSESLYLAAALGAWLLAERQRWLGAGALCAVASLVRVNGVFLCCALVVMYLVRTGSSGRRFQFRPVAGLLLGVGGAAAYFVYLFTQTGDIAAWFTAQSAGWGRKTVAPWAALGNSWMYLTGSANLTDQRIQVAADLVMAGLGVALIVVMAARGYWAEFTLSLLTFASLLTSTYYLSVTRSTLTVFPLMIVAASLLVRSRRRPIMAVSGVCAVWMCATMGAFSLQYWAG